MLTRREKEFAERGIESIGAYRRMRASGEIAGDGFGDVFLVVDGWLTLRQEFEALEQTITAIAARGLGYGVHVVASAREVVGVPARGPRPFRHPDGAAAG